MKMVRSVGAAATFVCGSAIMAYAWFTPPCGSIDHNDYSTCNQEPCKTWCNRCCGHFCPPTEPKNCFQACALGCVTAPAECPDCP